MVGLTSTVMLPYDRLKVSCVKPWYRQRDLNSRPQTCKDCALPTELCRHITVSPYNYYIPSVGSRTPFTVSVIRSLPLRAVDAYYIMPQPLHALGCFTADVATYILQPVDWLARPASVPLKAK